MESKAYAFGQHVVFGEGQYRPGTSDGDALLSHELTHLEQQAVDRPRIQRSPDPHPKRLNKRDRCDSYEASSSPCANNRQAKLPEGTGWQPAMDAVARVLDSPKDSPAKYVALVEAAICRLSPDEAVEVRDSFEQRRGTAGKKFGELSTASRCKILFALDARAAVGAARKREILEETIADEQKADARRKERGAIEAQHRREQQANVNGGRFPS